MRPFVQTRTVPAGAQECVATCSSGPSSCLGPRPCFYGVREGEDDSWSFVPEHEVAAYAVKDGKTGDWHGGRKQSTVWFIEHVKSDTGHGTQKPVECMRRPIENNSCPGQAVYEPFSGSGTTLIAAEMTGRACHAIELSPAYVDVAVLRWQAFTGQQAVRDGKGRWSHERGVRSPSHRCSHLCPAEPARIFELGRVDHDFLVRRR